MKISPINILFRNAAIMFCVCITLCCISFEAKAQDKIHKTDNSMIEAKVIEITGSVIKYKNFSNLNGPLYTINKADVKLIVYENGQTETFQPGNININQPGTSVMKDSVKCIEYILGVKLENTAENGGGIKIASFESNSIFTKQIPPADLSIYTVDNGNKVRVTTTSQLARVLFGSYNQGISKINLLSLYGTDLSYFTADPKGFDITGLPKCMGTDNNGKTLSMEESKLAGHITAGIYHPRQNWIMQGFCSGAAFGLPGVGLVGVAAIIPPNTPTPPPNVDANTWSKGYQSQIKKKRLLSGLIGGALGSLLAIAVFSSVN